MSTINNLLAQNFNAALTDQINKNPNASFETLLETTVNSKRFQSALTAAGSLSEVATSVKPSKSNKKAAKRKAKASSSKAAVATTQDTGEIAPKRGRGRPKGSKNKSKTATETTVVETPTETTAEASTEVTDGPYEEEVVEVGVTEEE